MVKERSGMGSEIVESGREQALHFTISSELDRRNFT